MMAQTYDDPQPGMFELTARVAQVRGEIEHVTEAMYRSVDRMNDAVIKANVAVYQSEVALQHNLRADFERLLDAPAQPKVRPDDCPQRGPGQACVEENAPCNNACAFCGRAM